MNDILKIKCLSKSLNDFYLGPLDLNIKRGSIVGYIGENGAGKSTTIKLILGDMKKDSGEIYIFGKKIVRFDRRWKEENCLCIWRFFLSSRDEYKGSREISLHVLWKFLGKRNLW